MKLFTLIALFFCTSLFAQETSKDDVFLRMYDLDGNKIAKGYLVSVHDTIVALEYKKELIKIPISKIDMIKTRRSPGHSALIGAAMGGIGFGVFGAAQADETLGKGNSSLEGAGIGLLAGAAGGALVGGATGLFSKAKTYEVNGNMEKFQDFLFNIKPVTGDLNVAEVDNTDK
ncbi:hypothetical protein [Mangrovimonas aestuarii]|uniref:hypothetical protein n=1 Tax=Mangrovimonas aestuarii TaxID=3018443 RepID=UPI002378C172|nr:hypothetical protein [Mangrovimonas aestuarii]